MLEVQARGPSRLRLSEFVQISEFFNIYIKDICQTSESFAKSVKLKEERAVSSLFTFRRMHSLLTLLGWVGVGIFTVFNELQWDKYM